MGLARTTTADATGGIIRIVVRWRRLLCVASALLLLLSLTPFFTRE